LRPGLEISQGFDCFSAPRLKAGTMDTIRELFDFLRRRKKYYLFPLVFVFFAIGGLLALSGSAATPFLYALF
jgi:hypothetical protein